MINNLKYLFYFNKQMHLPTLTSILSLKYLFFYRAPLSCANSLTNRNLC